MRCAIIIALFLSLYDPAAAQNNSYLRIWKVYPDTFDLILTSVFRADGKHLTASFNHRRGSTFFASDGEHIGPYKIISLDSSPNDSARAVLKDTRTSELYELNLNTSLALPGLRAQLVDVRNGLLWDVRRRDEIPDYGLTITSITDDRITASLQKGSMIVLPASTEERASVQSLWNQAKMTRDEAISASRKARQEAEAREAAALQEARAKAQAARHPSTIAAKSAPILFFGTEYRYPKSYAYYYTFEPTGGGVRAKPKVIAIPTEFETRMVGWSINIDQ